MVATAPQIGNTGWNDEDDESRGGKIWVAGYAVRDPSNRVSNWRASGTLDDALKAQHVVGIAGIDTRAVVRREHGQHIHRGTRWCAPVHGGRPGPGHQDQHTA
ncbi:Carbamoyl-phosphate synthase, small chain (CarA) [Mycobacteroides abscessus subsp. abscessus]|nr:Carbamoyl-phosphate synthase, small chain (CarA) [Mycobacteroides abscessus subsp. abscessus]